ncbi:hypothetical protein [Plantibacter sp. MMLR14_011]|uniref:hypothetical protein n=1 Tax=Plantibacter sp. MMLR14_011 TaxID=1898746 RepID=UPI0008DD4B58|nr:hypothetical protein [Plantibacter sp. MMLR14_011]OII41534.1 hypothetical protein BIU99_18315 [Plantibacter sp. MMLR14_011]
MLLQRNGAAVIYPEARHEIFTELNREDVERDVVEWLDKRTCADGASGTRPRSLSGGPGP